ncbi:MAG: glycosyltransferase family 2 protein [Butyrivibrio sp.]|nr:glycosyltransferase family 2 protein [Butyrivibrio sp.]
MSIRISVITPTYNRATVLYRVYESLKAQTYKDFEWIVIDDGSVDDTRTVVEEYIKENLFPIRYFYQENNGKHIALNEGCKKALGEMIVIADSDDSFTGNAFEVMLKYWDEIPDEDKKNYRGITCRCYDPADNSEIGFITNDKYLDLLGLDATYKYKINFEMWGINRRDLMLKFPFPDIRRTDKGGLHFFPETVIWDNMGRNYKVRYINECLRAYYKDQDNATTNVNNRRSQENIYLWEHLINDVLDYFWYSPMRFIKAFVGITMDGLLNGESYFDIVKRGKNAARRVGIMMFSPFGFVLFLKHRKKCI